MRAAKPVSTLPIEVCNAGSNLRARGNISASNIYPYGNPRQPAYQDDVRQNPNRQGREAPLRGLDP
jgi:hypothetical protein